MSTQGRSKSLGRRLRKLRTGRGLSQKELGAPLCTHAYVSEIEAGKRTPSDRVLQHFASKLGVDAHELLSGQPTDLVEQLELGIVEARHLLSSGALQEALSAYRRTLEKARRWNLGRQESRALHGIGLCAERAGSWEEAIDRYEEAESKAEARFSDVHADIVAGKARCLENLGDSAQAIYVLDRLIRDLKRRGVEDPLALVKLYAPLAFSACEVGFYTQAAEAAAAALALEPGIEDPLTIAITHVNVARVLLQQGEKEAALRSLHKAEELFDQLDLKLEIARVHLAHGFTLARIGESSKAITHLNRSLSTFRQIGSQVDQARTLVELGRVRRAMGEFLEAAEILRNAIALLRQQEHIPELALSHRELGLSLFTHDPPAAEKNLREATRLYERSEAPLQVALTYRYPGELMESLGTDGCDEFRRASLSLPLDV
jgi:tetratricopeptide (TPR) repeat protein